MLVPAFLAFAAAVGLADLAGPGHQWGGLALLTGWFLSARLLQPRAWRGILTAALALSVAIAVLAVVQMWWLPRARGPFASPNFLGAYSVLMLFLAIARNGDKVGEVRPIAVAANLLSLALSQSRGALLALGAGLLVMLWRRHPRWALLAAAIATLTAVTIRSGVDEARWEIWRLGWQAAMLRPVTGWGQGGLVIGGLDVFYSIPLEVFIESGLLGVLTGAWLLIAAAIQARPEPDAHVADSGHQASNGKDHPAWRHMSGIVPRGWSIQTPAFRPLLAAWFVQGLFLFSIPATNVLLVTVLAYLASEHRNIADRACGVDNDEPALDGRVRAGGAD
jgi:hypothetical protein